MGNKSEQYNREEESEIKVSGNTHLEGGLLGGKIQYLKQKFNI